MYFFVWQESEGGIVTDNFDETDYVDYNNFIIIN